jgi:sec-independent protein translocase protein TatA
MNILNAPLAAFMGMGSGELMIVLVIMLVLFGGAKLPQLAKGLGQSVKEFKKASKEEDDDEKPSESKKTVEAGKTHGSN